MKENRYRVHPSPYYNGHEARRAGRPKVAPSTLSIEMRHWWLFGWNEADQELAA